MKQRLYKDERQFGLIVGGVFALISIWWIYRGKFMNVAPITGVLGFTLILFGMVAPRLLVYPNKGWMLLSEGLSFVSQRILLGIVFFLVVTPIGQIKRLFGWDPLNRRSGTRSSYWRDYSNRQHNPQHYEKMY